MGQRSGNDEKEQKPRKGDHVKTHIEVEDAEARARPATFSYWEGLVMCVKAPRHFLLQPDI